MDKSAIMNKLFEMERKIDSFERRLSDKVAAQNKRAIELLCKLQLENKISYDDLYAVLCGPEQAKGAEPR